MYGYGDPNWSTMKSDEQWKGEGGIICYQWVHLEKYDVSNLPPCSKDMIAKEKARLMKDLSTELAEEKEKRANFFKDLDGIH